MLLIYQDDHLLATNKPAGEPAVPDKTRDPSLLDRLSEELGQQLFPINRLDRPVSGLLLFARDKMSAAQLSAQIRSGKMIKEYFAAVANKPADPEATLVHYLEKRKQKAFIVSGPVEGKKATLSYRYLGSGDRYHFLYIRLISGRFHQIRAQLGHIGCPVKGDVKYGARRANPDRSIHLHARSLTFTHPATGETLCLQAPLPDEALWSVLNLTLS